MRIPGHPEIDAAIANAIDAGEDLTIEGAVAALYPCEVHCSACDGDDHHWLVDCAEGGDPIMVCKHCPAWRFPRYDEPKE